MSWTRPTSCPHGTRSALRVVGQETRRLVQVEQEVLARLCEAPGCRTLLKGRQRNWCIKHRRHPGGRRHGWLNRPPPCALPGGIRSIPANVATVEDLRRGAVGNP